MNKGRKFRYSHRHDDASQQDRQQQRGVCRSQLNLWDRLFGTAGIRQDEYNVFGSATTYRVTAGYLLKETGTKLRGSYEWIFFQGHDDQSIVLPGFWQSQFEAGEE